MKQKKDILLFLDLEGTLLSEETGDFKNDELLDLLEQLDILEKMMEAKIHIGILSPVFKKDSEKIINNIDRMIARYNMNEHRWLNEIEFAAADFIGEMKGQDDLYDKIIPLPRPINHRETDYSAYGKFACAKQWVEMFKEKGSLAMVLYGGNGLNDVKAMKYVRSLENGFVMCPNNSYGEIKTNIAHFVSDKDDMQGLIQNFKVLNDKIQTRKVKEATENKQSKEGYSDER